MRSSGVFGDKGMRFAGVQMPYGMELGDLDQNVIDAIAVGHCHLAKNRDAGIVEGRQTKTL